MIYASENELQIVKGILKKHLPAHAKVWVFGSRATGVRLKKFSDLDLAIDIGERMSLRLLGQLDEDFVWCLLPYRVDVIDWASTQSYFKEIVESDFVPLNFLDEDPK